MMPQRNWQSDDEIPGLRFGPITTETLVRWAAVSGDYNRIHFDQEYARSQGLPNVIMHGPFKLALLCRMLTDWLGAEGVIRRIRVRYTAMDLPGNTLEFGGRIQSVQEGHGQKQSPNSPAACSQWARGANGERRC